jgi:hypothetical protein
LPVQMSSAGVLTAAVATRPQLPAVGQQVSASSGAFSTASASLVDVTYLTVTITTTGRPVVVGLQPDGTNLAYVGGANTGGAPVATYYALLRGSTVIAYTESVQDGTGPTTGIHRVSPGTIHCVDVVGAGTYTYKLQISKAAGTSAEVAYCVLYAYEL